MVSCWCVPGLGVYELCLLFRLEVNFFTQYSCSRLLSSVQREQYSSSRVAAVFITSTHRPNCLKSLIAGQAPVTHLCRQTAAFKSGSTHAIERASLSAPHSREG